MTEKNENRWAYLTSSEINALPPKVRDYIMNLEQQLEAFGESTMRLLTRAEAAETVLADALRTLTCPHRSDATRVSDALKILRNKKP